MKTTTLTPDDIDDHCEQLFYIDPNKSEEDFVHMLNRFQDTFDERKDKHADEKNRV